MLRLSLRLAIATICLSCIACSITPWVDSYERGYLADPIMAFDSHPASTRYMNHVYEAREAGRGAEGSAGGGCGCN